MKRERYFRLQPSGLRPGWLYLFVWLLSSGGCADYAPPEEEIRALISAAAIAAQNKNLGDLRHLISDSYSDGRGNRKPQIVQLIRFYLLQHQSVHLYVHVESIEFPAPELAKAGLVVAMAGRGVPDGSDWRVNAELYDIDVNLERDSGTWRVITADWKRSGP